MKNNRPTLTFLLLWLASSPLFAQQVPEEEDPIAAQSEDLVLDSVAPPSEEKNWFNTFLDKIGADGGYDSSKPIDFSYLPGPFYNPEMEFGIGLSIAGLYQLDKTDTISPISTLVINTFASTNKSIGLSIENQTFLDEDTHRFYVNAEIAKTPYVYYGIGYDSNHTDDNKVNYTASVIGAAPNYMFRINDLMLIGAGFDYTYLKVKDVEGVPSESFNNATSGTPFPEGNKQFGVTLHLLRDSRDYIVAPSAGSILEVNLATYFDQVGDDQFSTYLLNFAKYVSVGPGVLAWQAQANITSGDVPWNMMPRGGGANAMRGYNDGRYRDKQLIFGQAEYRLNLKGRHGVVFWAGTAFMADTVSDFDWAQSIPSAGVGYRFRVKGRMNLRLDYGYGKDESGVYFNVNESF